MPAPWDRLPNETSRQHEAFLAFRDLPPSERSILRLIELERTRRAEQGQDRGAASVLTLSKDTLYRWYHEFDWDRRVRAWDAHVRAQRDAALVEKARAEGERQAAVAVEMLTASQAVFAELQKRLGRGMLDRVDTPTLLKFCALAVRLYQTASLSLRLIGGQPTAAVAVGMEQRVSVDLSGVPTDELRALLRELTSHRPAESGERDTESPIEGSFTEVGLGEPTRSAR